MSAIDLLIVGVGLAFAGFAKGLTGMGLPLVATPILAGVFGPRAAVVIVTIPVLTSNTILLLQGVRRLELLRGLAPMVVAGAVGSLIGVNLLASLDQRTFALLITTMVVLFLARGDRLIGDDPGALRARIIGPIVGFVGGVLQGTTSISSPIVGSFFHARKLPPRDYVVVLAAMFELNGVVQILGYSFLGLYTPEIVTLGLLGLIPSLLALMLGIFLRGRADPAVFRRLIIALLVLSVANLLWRSFGPA